MTAPVPQTDPVGFTLEVLAAVLGPSAAGAMGAARSDTPLAALGADPLALVMWADAVAAATGADVDDGALARVHTVGELAATLSATMAADTLGAPDAPPPHDPEGTR